MAKLVWTKTQMVRFRLPSFKWTGCCSNDYAAIHVICIWISSSRLYISKCSLSDALLTLLFRSKTFQSASKKLGWTMLHGMVIFQFLKLNKFAGEKSEITIVFTDMCWTWWEAFGCCAVGTFSSWIPRPFNTFIYFVSFVQWLQVSCRHNVSKTWINR